MTLDAADVVVVGSGAFGASAAYHLARFGAHVAVLERAGLASQTSPRAAGLTSQVRASPALTRLARRAVAKLAAFTGETGEPLRFTQSGALKIARTERDAEQLAHEVARGGAAGVPIDFVSVAEARQRLPILGERDIVAVTWSPTDCNVEPSELPLGYCRAAAVVRRRRAAARHRGAVAARAQRERAVPDLPGSDPAHRRASRRATDNHGGRPLPRGAVTRRGRGLGDERLLRRGPQHLAGARRGARRVDRRRRAGSRPLGDLHRALRRARARRGRAARAMPPGLRDPLSREQRADVNHRRGSGRGPRSRPACRISPASNGGGTSRITRSTPARSSD